MFDFISVAFGYVLRFIYDLIQNYGLAIVVFTIFTKVLMYPLQLQSKKSSRQMQKLQPKQAELQKKYANNKQKYQEELSKLYQEEKVNPAGSCLPLLITLPIMLGLYSVIRQPLTYLMNVDSATIETLLGMYNVGIENPLLITDPNVEITLAQYVTENFANVSSLSANLLAIDFNFLGFNLSAQPTFTAISILWLIPIISGATSFFSMWFMQKAQGMSMEGQPAAMRSMMLVSPLMSAYFGFIFPVGVSLYWITGNVCTILQDIIMRAQLKREDAKNKSIQDEINEREARNRQREMELKKEEQRRISKENAEKNKKG